MLGVFEGFFDMLDPKSTKAYEAPDEPEMVDEPDDIELANQQVAAAGDAAEAAEFGEPEMVEDETMDEPEMIDSPEEGEIDDPVEEELPELEGGAVDGVGDEMPPEDAEMPVEGEMPPGEDPSIEFAKKENIHKNTLQLLSIVTVSKDAFEQKFGSKLEGEQYHDYHKIMSGFEDLIDIMSDTLEKKFATGSYNTLIRYYVSMVKVYDILTKMTENFVDDYIKENEETKA